MLFYSRYIMKYFKRKIDLISKLSIVDEETLSTLDNYLSNHCKVVTKNSYSHIDDISESVLNNNEYSNDYNVYHILDLNIVLCTYNRKRSNIYTDSIEYSQIIAGGPDIISLNHFLSDLLSHLILKSNVEYCAE